MCRPRGACGWCGLALCLGVLGLVAGCGTAPPAGGGRTGAGSAAARDGPPAAVPGRLAQLPDAVPRVEPLRVGGPNKPYEINGRRYVPLTADVAHRESGLASWYGRKFHGRPTANGETYDMFAMSAAHPTLPLPSYARVRNPANGREVIVRVNDRGPFVPGRVIDLSYAAALRLDLLRGVAPVELERLTHEEIASGAWRRGTGEEPVPPAPAAAAVTATPLATPAAEEPAARAVVAAAPVADPAAAESMPAQAPAAAAVAVSAAAAPPPPDVTDAAAPRRFWLQLGAFRERVGAERFRDSVAVEADWLAPLLSVFEERALHRLQAGPYPSRDAARGAAERIREALRLVPQIVERR